MRFSNKGGYWASLNLAGFFGDILDGILTITPSRLMISFGVSLVSAASTLAFFIFTEPFTTNPVELLGCTAYYRDINIANRLAAISLTILVSLLTFVIFGKFFNSRHGQGKNTDVVFGYCLLPSLLWLSSILLHPQSNFNMFWVNLSTYLCWFAILAFLRERKDIGSDEKLTITLVCFGLSFFIAPALLVFVKSVLFWNMAPVIDPKHIPNVLSIISYWLSKLYWMPALFVFILWIICPKPKVLLLLGLYPVQIFLLFFNFLVLPSFFLVDGVFTQFFNSSRAFCFIVLPLFLSGAWDCTRRCVFKNGSPLSPFPFVGLLLYFLLCDSPVPGFQNLYEFGSRFPEFWMSFNGWATLFKDVYITYGLWDYAQYLFSWLFSGQHTAAVSTYGSHIFYVLVMVLQFFAVFSILPLGYAFLLCLISGVGPQSVILIFIAILLHPRLANTPFRWISIWIALSSITPFARIPQGTMCVVSSLPAFLWQASRLFCENKRAFWQLTGLSFLACFFMAIWPFGQYFWGLIRIFTETASVNSAWAANFWSMRDTPLINVLLGNAIIVMPSISLIGLITLWSEQKQSNSFAFIFLFSFITLYAFVSVSYGFSRTDK